MKAAVLFEAKTPLQIEEVVVSKPAPREVLIRTVAVGVCRSDLHFIDGAWPHPVPTVPGHEAAGVVEAVGSDVVHVKPGDHVITFFTAFCGTCEFCVSGRPSLCLDPSTKRPPTAAPRLSLADQTPVHTFLNLSAYAEMMLVRLRLPPLRSRWSWLRSQPRNSTGSPCSMSLKRPLDTAVTSWMNSCGLT